MPTDKTESILAAESIAHAKRTRFNPIRGLTPRKLSGYIDAWRVGRLRDFANVAQEIEERDDTLMSVAPKRKKKIGSYSWEIVQVDTDRTKEAARHAEVLEGFFNNVHAENAWEPEERGGWAMLCRQMLDAVGKKRAVHEIIWHPEPGRIRATFRFVPLWFFEMTTGRLRFSLNGTEAGAQPLEEGGWMITTGDGIMVACSILYMFKSLPMRDWVNYTEKFGFPLPHLGVNASPDSKEWQAAAAALSGIVNNSSFLYNNNGGAVFGVESFGSTGQLPFEALIDRCDRRMAALWRGSDLSTFSAKDSVGAENQKGEEEIHEADDAMAIQEALEHYVSNHVLDWHFGVGTEPLAYIKVKTGDRTNAIAEQTKLDKAIDKGVPVAVRDYRETLAIPTPELGSPLVGGGTFAGDETPPTPTNPKPEPDPELDPETAANASDPEELAEYIAEGERMIGERLMRSHEQFLLRLAGAAAIEDAAERESALAELRAGLADEFSTGFAALTDIFEAIEGTALVEGAIQGEIER